MAIIGMHLRAEPFDRIRAGKKSIEIRVYDGKRRKVKIGDTIIFIKGPRNTEKIETEVLGLSVFRSFHELFSSIDKSKLGQNPNLSFDDWIKSLRDEYTEEEERENGVVAIHIKLLS